MRRRPAEPTEGDSVLHAVPSSALLAPTKEGCASCARGWTQKTICATSLCVARWRCDAPGAKLTVQRKERKVVQSTAFKSTADGRPASFGWD